MKIINVGDDCYKVKGTMKVSEVDKDGTNIWKQRWRCNSILRNGDLYYFCQKIITAEYTDIY